MKTLLTPSLIAAACFSALSVAADVSFTAQSSTSGQQQVNQHSGVAEVNSDQHAGSNVSVSARPVSGAAAAGNSDTQVAAQSTATLATPEQPETAEAKSTLLANPATDSTATLAGAAESSAVLTQNLLMQGVQNGTTLTDAATAQLRSSTSQLVQQNASAAVAQSVSQAVSAEVNNTVRNTLKLSTGL